MKSVRLSWILLWVAACRGPAAQGSLPRPGPSEPPANVILMSDSGWGRVHIAALSLSLELPEAGRWRAEGGRDWYRLVHEATDSTLEIRRSRVPVTARPSDCAAEAGLALGDGDAEASATSVDRRSGVTPGDLRFELAVRVDLPASGPGLVGSVETAAVGARACVAIRLRTGVDGIGGEAEVARRLGVFADRVLPSLTLVRVEDRIVIPREPGPTLD